MKPLSKSCAIRSILLLLAGTGLTAWLFYALHPPSLSIINLPFHSTIEAIGGMSALLTAMVLYRQQTLRSNPAFFPVATGFACMGTLDIFHAMCLPGNAFVFLHSSASLAGGFFFAWSCLPNSILLRYAKEQKWFAGIFLIISSSIGFRAVFFPRDVPVIIKMYDGAFTPTAIFINSLACVFFLISVPAIFIRYRRTGNDIFLVFVAVATLFGVAELIFGYSDTWDTVWWIWHMLRFTALILTLFFVISCYRQLCDTIFGSKKSMSSSNTTDRPYEND